MFSKVYSDHKSYRKAKNLVNKIRLNKVSQSRDATPMHSHNNSFTENEPKTYARGAPSINNCQ